LEGHDQGRGFEFPPIGPIEDAQGVRGTAQCVDHHRLVGCDLNDGRVRACSRAIQKELVHEQGRWKRLDVQRPASVLNGDFGGLASPIAPREAKSSSGRAGAVPPDHHPVQALISVRRLRPFIGFCTDRHLGRCRYRGFRHSGLRRAFRAFVLRSSLAPEEDPRQDSRGHETGDENNGVHLP
jgi:hypothetical protein